MKEKRTYIQRKESIKRAVTKRRKRIREMAVEHKGGKCELCGYNKCIGALDFHHIDPRIKEFSISVDGNTRAWTRVKKEIEKCILICANCHREKHWLKKYKALDIPINIA